MSKLKFGMVKVPHVVVSIPNREDDEHGRQTFFCELAKVLV